MPFPPTHAALERALTARAYAEPTDVQRAVLLPEANGRDLLVSAQTGSGKTVAFGLAMASRLLGANEQFERAAEPLALIVAPTRELAMQVQRELAWLYAQTGARVATCVGGMDIRGEKKALAAGAHIVVGTPGRLRDHIERGRLDTSWLRTVVLDEADEMLDLGFREDLQFILDATPAERQTLMFSATMPREIAALAKQYQRDALRIETGSRNTPHEDIEYRAILTAPIDAELAVVNVLRFYETKATLVFCATREGVKRMHLSLAKRGFEAVALSGELSQGERTQALQSLRDGRSRVLVATDVAARGLDLPDLALVIHADLPNDKETLLHRSGRTGRAGRKGVCVVIVPRPRRRRAEQLLADAGVKVTWAPPPSPDDIKSRDHERLLADPMFSDVATAEELVHARALLEGRTAEDLAVAFLRLHSARLPKAGDVLPASTSDRYNPDTRPRFDAPRGAGFGRDRDASDDAREPNSRERRDFNRADTTSYAVRTPGRPRTERDDMAWFRINIGRAQNADPRWLLPLICRAGDVTKAEIGVIRILDRDSHFQIANDHAERFAAAIKADTRKEAQIARVSTKGDAAPATAVVDESPAWDTNAADVSRPQRPKSSPNGTDFKPDGYKSKGVKPKGHPRDGKPRGHANDAGKAPFKAPFKTPYKKKARPSSGA